ncbi:carbohydrate ABC transporter permease [Puerhibacterium sp. TATVAM-FAB25]|uniref:carbohydrate ABC transporter permease n=1 Tax=Puerhibacterium sp. TATVAM-FAB25 TaxID=3093699 RepID=UPI00397D59B7
MGIVYVGIGYTAGISRLSWDGLSPAPRAVGLDNYATLLGDPTLWRALRNVAIFAVLTVGIQMVLGFIIAQLMVMAGRWTGIFKVMVFLPVVLAPAAIATTARQLLAAGGDLNVLLRDIGLGALATPWLADPGTALYAIVAINVFQWTGFSALLYQAALTQIDQNTLEAAQLDGAGTVRTITSVVLPQLRGTHATLIITGVIGAIKTFDVVYLTTGGGPGGVTEFVTTYLYRLTVNQFQVGLGAALTVLMLALTLALTLVQMRAYRFGEQR